MKKAVSIFFILVVVGAGVFFYLSYRRNQSSEMKYENVEAAAKTKSNSNTAPLPTSGKSENNMTISADSSNVAVSDEKKKIQIALQHVREKSRTPSAQMKAIPDKLLTNSSLDSRWKIWPTVRAVPIEQVQAADVVVTELKRYDVINVPTQEANLKEFHKDALPVVYDSRLKKPGLVTGMIKVVTSQKDLLQADLDKQNAFITNAFENINTYYVTSYQSIFDLEKLYQTLKAKAYTENIEIDIADRDYEKK